MKLIQFIGAVRAIVFALLLFPAIAHGKHRSDVPADTLLNLGDLLAELRTSNPSLRASRLEAEALATRGRQVSALPDPSVRIVYQPYSLLTARGKKRSQWSVEQIIPYPGKTGLQRDIADLSAEVEGFEAATFEEDLLHQVKQAYYELYRIQQQEQHLLAFQDRLRSFEEAAATRYEVGVDVQQAILKAQLEKNTLSRLHLELSEQRRTAAETLARLLNRPTSNAFMAAIQVEPPPFIQFDAVALLKVALRERPEVDALAAAAHRADAEIALARKQFKPDFGLNVTFFDIGKADVPTRDTGRDAIAIGAVIKVPLQRARLRAQLEEAHVRRRLVNARKEALETSFTTQIADLMNRLREVARQLALFQEGLIPQAELTLQATLSSYTTGRTDYLDLLDAERTLFSLGTTYEDTFARYLKVTAALERVLGVVSLADLSTR